MKEIEADNKIWLGIMVVMVNAEGQILMGRRKNAFAEGQYGIPSGHIEVGEMFQQGAIREIAEETGVRVNTCDLNLLAITNYIVPEWDRQYITFDFMVDKWTGDIGNTEPNKCAGWEWFDAGKLPQNLHYPASRTIAHYLKWKETGKIVLA